MDDIRWQEVTLTTAAEELDGLCAKLTARGVTGMVIEDEADFQRFLEENRQYWDYVDDALLEKMKGAARVKLYVTDDTDGEAEFRRFTDGLGAGVTVEKAPLASNDWATSWQKYYKPMPVGEKVYIVPKWERGKAVPEGRTAVYLNPGLTFGTGSHASTQLCLGLLEKHLCPGGAVLDLGCGSGILSIAALNLGCGKAVGVDIDPKAVDVAYENAQLNGIDRDRYLVRAGNVLSDKALVEDLAGGGPYPVVLANIVADVIIPLSAQAGGYLAPGGVFICSGIIDTRADEVQAALERNGLRILERVERDGWCALAAALE